jgi:hypothetical protein
MANIVPLARIVKINLMRMRSPDASFVFLKSAPIAQQTYLVFAMLGIFSDGRAGTLGNETREQMLKRNRDDWYPEEVGSDAPPVDSQLNSPTV